MLLTNGKESRPVISTFEQMSTLKARWTKGDIAIDQSVEHPGIYFCTVPDGTDVPIGITPSSPNILTYFTPYYIDAALVTNGIENYVAKLVSAGDVESLLTNIEYRLTQPEFQKKLVTLPALAALFNQTYVRGVNADGSYLIVDNSNYKDLIEEDYVHDSCSLIIGAWDAPISEYTDIDRDYFLPHEVSVGVNDTAILKIKKYVYGESENRLIKEFILYRTESAENYCIRYLSVDGGVWKNITTIDHTIYAQKAKELYDRNQMIWQSLIAKYDSINQIYRHDFLIEELKIDGTIDATQTIMIQGADAMAGKDNKVILNLTKLEEELLTDLEANLSTNPATKNLKITNQHVEDIIIRLNLLTAVNLEENTPDTKLLCDSAFLDLRTLLGGGVHYIRVGNQYFRMNTSADLGSYINIPVDYLLCTGETELTLDMIKERIGIYVMNVKWNSKI